MPFSEEQPRAGDTILHCGHLEPEAAGRGMAHWFKYESPVRFARPDGSRGQSEWLVICEPCFIKHGHEVHEFPVRGDGQWTGDAPSIEREEN